MTIANDINQKQNEAESIALLKAADAAYRYARRADLARTAITLLSVGSAMFGALRTDFLEAQIVAGAAGTVANEAIRQYLTLRWTRMGMFFQEWFDTHLFGLSWSQALGRKPREEDRRYWEKRFRGDVTKKENWYIDVEGLPRSHAILLCQRENLTWDARLRRIWGSTLLIMTIGWVAFGVMVGVFGDWKIWELLARWLAPSAPAIVFAVLSGVRHREVAREKDALADRIEDLLEAVPVRSAQGQKRMVSIARELQDHVARLRTTETRVPGWLFEWLRSSYEDEARTAAERWRDRLVRDVREQKKSVEADTEGA